MRIKRDVAIHVSLLLSTANILGSSGLMVWIDHALHFESADLTAYYPLLSYLLGLSLGCCILGLVSPVYKRIVSESFFLILLVVALSVCTALAVGDGIFSEGFELFLRFLWGGASGCTVILGRAMLASPRRSSEAYKNFSALSFALASMPLIVPVVFAIFFLQHRPVAAIFAATVYAFTLVVYLVDGTGLAIEDPCPAGDNLGLKSGSLNCFTLIISNVVFFLILILVPMVKALIDPGLEILHIYGVILCVWLVVGWIVFRYFQSLSSMSRLKFGFFVQLIMLGSCLWVLFVGRYSVFYLIFFMAFISNMLVQPTLFTLLGHYAFNKLLLFGIQSGVYIFVVFVLLAVSVFVGFSIRSVFLLLSVVIAISLTCLHVFLLDFRKASI
ncbi:hypothetical protein [Pseudomonas sp. ES3-33]|uniref:hypothetical protein n=1 Tax=Pseudomonas sp. ES3-33 TaxID=1628833 RepID=UPI0005D33063|nr:hypothetical protein [Pseudomonas sp. ES3-33]KJH77423.1 hypothetical protein UB23_08625 [Pseudomonas sp. ES3-33]